MRKRKIVIAGLVCFVVLGAPAWAGWSKTAVDGYIVAASVSKAGTQTMDDLGVLHVRGSVTEETLAGDLQGTLTVYGNMDLDVVTGAGRMWGLLQFVGTVGDDDTVGTYTGVWGGPISGFALDVDWVMVGSGAFRGTWLRVDNTGYVLPPGSDFIPQPYEGYVYACSDDDG